MVQLSPCKDPPRCKVSCQGVMNRLALSLRPCFVEASPTVEKAVSCYKVDRLVASLPSCRSVQSSLAVCEFVLQGRTLRTRPRTGVYKSDVMELKAYQNNRSYVSSVDLLSNSLCKDLPWRAVTWRISKNHKTVKIWG